MSKPIVFILGAGSNVGNSVAKTFAAAGYEIALAARSLKDDTSSDGFRTFHANFSKRSAIHDVFATVEATLGVPNVVVYNAASMTTPDAGGTAFTLPIETIERDLRVNTLNAMAAAQYAIKSFDRLPEGESKVFIYTGNFLNKVVLPMDAFVTLGMGKSASAYWVAAAGQLYQKSGYRFFYADQRTPEGGAMQGGVDGNAHADFYMQLVSEGSSLPSHATFVKVQGYKLFTS